MSLEKTIITLPSSTDTLSLYNINIPFIVADKNQSIIDKALFELDIKIKNLDIYTDSQYISIISDGIKDVLTMDYSQETAVVSKKSVIIADTFLKSTTTEGVLVETDPLNIVEFKDKLGEKGFLRNTQVFETNLEMSKFMYSNFVSLEELSGSLFEREYDASVENGKTLTTKSLLVGSMKGLDSDAISRDELIKITIPRFEQIEKIQISESELTRVKAESCVLEQTVMADEYIPIEDGEVETVSRAKEQVRLLNEDIESSIFIDNPSFLSPINKEYALDISDKYISKEERAIRDIRIDRYAGSIEEDHILTYSEADSYIQEFFLQFEAPSINGVDEFKNYLSQLCGADESYIGLDFEIEGGVIYLGFDYNNMYSIFNEVALEKILFLDYGKWTEIDGETTRASNYFSDQNEINRFLAYAQQIGYEVDLGLMKIADLFRVIRAVTSDVCNFSPSLEGILNDPEIPAVPEAQSVYVIIPPTFTSSILLYPFFGLIAPFYVEVSKFYSTIPPIFNPAQLRPKTWLLQEPMPSAVYSGYIITPLSLNDLERLSRPSFDELREPLTAICGEYTLYTKTDGKRDNLVFYLCTDDNERHRVISTRSFNMLDINAIVESIIGDIGEFYFLGDCVITAAEYLAILLSGISCTIVENTGFAANIDIAKMLFKDDGDIEQSISSSPTCVFGAVPGRSGSERILDIGLQTSGSILRKNGYIEGTPFSTNTEMIAETESISVPAWGSVGDDDFNTAVETIAATKSGEITSYIENHRIDNVSNLSDLYDLTPEIVEDDTFSHIENQNSAIKSYALAILDQSIVSEYVRVEYPDNSKGYEGNGDVLGLDFDEKGIFSSSVSEIMTKYFIRKFMFSNLGSSVVDLHYWNPSTGVVYENINQTLKTRFTTDVDKFMTIVDEGIYIEVLLSGSQVQVQAYAVGDFSFSFSSKEIDGLMWLVISSGEKDIPIGLSSYTSVSSGSLKLEETICDPRWSKGFVSVRGMTLGDELVPDMVTGFGGFFPEELEEEEGEEEEDEEEEEDSPGGFYGNLCLDCSMNGESGLPMDSYDNISNPADFSPDIPIDFSSEPTKIPGSFLMNLTLSVSRMASFPKTDGTVFLHKEKGRITVPVVFGVIDGMADSAGDILSQKLTSDEIGVALAGATKQVYCGPCSDMTDYLSGTETASGGFIGSVNLKSLIENVGSSDLGCNKFTDIGTVANAWTVSVNANDNENLIPAIFNELGGLERAGVLSVSDFGYTAMRTSFKHASANAEYPVATGGDSIYQKDLDVGRRLVTSSVPSGFISGKFPGSVDGATEEVVERMIQPNMLNLFTATDGLVIYLPRMSSPVDGMNKIITFKNQEDS